MSVEFPSEQVLIVHNARKAQDADPAGAGRYTITQANIDKGHYVIIFTNTIDHEVEILMPRLILPADRVRSCIVRLRGKQAARFVGDEAPEGEEDDSKLDMVIAPGSRMVLSEDGAEAKVTYSSQGASVILSGNLTK